METLHTILLSSPPSFSHWLISSDPDATIATQFRQVSVKGGWEEGGDVKREKGGGGGGGGDTKKDEGEEVVGKEEKENEGQPADSGLSSLEEVDIKIHSFQFNNIFWFPGNPRYLL